MNKLSQIDIKKPQEWGTFVAKMSVPADLNKAIDRIRQNGEFYLVNYLWIAAFFALITCYYSHAFLIVVIISALVSAGLFLAVPANQMIGGVKIENIHKLVVVGIVTLISLSISETFGVLLTLLTLSSISAILHA